mgnify:CR=1 FL=1
MGLKRKWAALAAGCLCMSLCLLSCGNPVKPEKAEQGTEVKEETKEESKEETKEEPKEEQKEEPKEEPKEETPAKKQEAPAVTVPDTMTMKEPATLESMFMGDGFEGDGTFALRSRRRFPIHTRVHSRSFLHQMIQRHMIIQEFRAGAGGTAGNPKREGVCGVFKDAGAFCRR